MAFNEEETRFHLIDPVLRRKGYDDPQRIRLETPAPVEPAGPKGRRSKRGGRTDYLLCVQVGDMPKPLPVAVLEAKRESEDPLKGMEQAKGYADCTRFDVLYVFASNGHLYGDFDKPSGIQTGPHPLEDFPSHPDLCARYAKDKGVDLASIDAALLFQADSPAWSATRYYQDAAIRAAFEKIILARQAGPPSGHGPRVLLTLATGAGKTIIATNLLWRMAQAGLLPKPVLFLCDRDELREQAYTRLKAAFGGNARIVETERRGERGHGAVNNAAANARIHIATYQTLGIDENGDGSFLTDHYGEDSFSVIIIDECHRSAWGKWSQALTRNPNAIHIGLTATPRKLKVPKNEKKSKDVEAAIAADDAITAHNVEYFGEPVYEYTLAQAQEDGYLAACEIVKRKADIDARIFTREEILKAGVRDIKTGKPLAEEDLTRKEYTSKDFDDELFIDLRTPKMCEDLFRLLCENGGPEQKVIIFCTRDLHADRVAMQMNKLYAQWCKQKGQPRKDDYAFKCTASGGADKIEVMRGSGERSFIACTVDLLEAGVDIERLNAVVFFRYLQSAIKFYQMVGRGTRIHEETQKYKFWLYDYTGVTDLFGVDFITQPPHPGGGGGSDGGDGGGGGDAGEGEGSHVAEIRAPYDVIVNAQGRFILANRGGVATPIPVDDYRREVIARVLAEAHNLDDFRALWIEAKKRRQLIDHLLGDHYVPDLVRDAEQMDEFDLFDVFGKYGYNARALKRPERGAEYVSANAAWFAGMDPQSAIVLKGLGTQFAQGGTDALEKQELWAVPEIARAGGLEALRALGKPVQVMRDAKMRLFGV
ncbi:MAG: DEAD/DEAH box helicase family protein [Candidatus Accumulibacter phosphatis]|uniref:Type I restriction enzyme EcoKI subunit R n=1 Tax=Candidatus Accumulibacter cognatus TaxID=2954383 RepID=A0A080MET1_9PROT|nr:DEAD/DEAH box helicase family protein [Candidatus Accumulibacter cognatus]KFB75699.1 MAG: type I restriction enzyme EcoKI subunit R [Candidatus Accumulibacter cognatus]MCQ1551141.1 DEAD/DEAH box helicase family protein [Candidatus Accumulibacter phosphatis]